MISGKIKQICLLVISFVDVEKKKTQRINKTKNRKNADNDELGERQNVNLTLFGRLINWNFAI